MSGAPAPIETAYRGYRFRSRLEARWAVFFDEIGVNWRYEVEGYVTDAGPYLPDFILQIEGRPPIYFEVKGASGEDVSYVCFDGAEKVVSFAKMIGERGVVVVAGDIPDPTQLDEFDSIPDQWYEAGVPTLLRTAVGPWGEGVVSHWPGIWLSGYFFMVPDDHDERLRDGLGRVWADDYGMLIANHGMKQERDDGSRYRQYFPVEALRVARSARFEHGETPVYRGGRA